MRVLVEGHKYQAQNFERPEGDGQIIDFIQKVPVEGSNSGEMKTIQEGTTNEELLKILLNRMNYLQAKFPCHENALAITKMDEALLWLEKRTNDRKARGVEGKHLK